MLLSFLAECHPKITMITGFDDIITTQNDNSMKEISAERFTLTSMDIDYYCRQYKANAYCNNIISGLLRAPVSMRRVDNITHVMTIIQIQFEY